MTFAAQQPLCGQQSLDANWPASMDPACTDTYFGA
jgi:hypothetical protein